jgi:isocitrate/isopropylmalate dehydrogenase
MTANMSDNIPSDMCVFLKGEFGSSPGSNIGKKHAIFKLVYRYSLNVARCRIVDLIAATRSTATIFVCMGW